MRILIQRVSNAKVIVGDQTVGAIQKGALVFLGVTHEDQKTQAEFLAKKLLNLRMFSDNEDKMNLSLLDIQGEVLIVSQFTLYGDCLEGRRPSFIKSSAPSHSEPLYRHFVEEVKRSKLKVETGIFGEMMQVHLINDGPVTFLVEK